MRSNDVMTIDIYLQVHMHLFVLSLCLIMKLAVVPLYLGVVYV